MKPIFFPSESQNYDTTSTKFNFFSYYRQNRNRNIWRPSRPPHPTNHAKSGLVDGNRNRSPFIDRWHSLASPSHRSLLARPIQSIE
ncbi:unnamed protein product, partial [Musa acuminata subsp. burmannicoides]